jgi:hypothetical protein
MAGPRITSPSSESEALAQALAQNKEILMRTIGGLVLVAALMTAGFAMWSTSMTLAKQSEATAPFAAPVRAISAHEIHRSTNLMNLPVQGMDEQAI